MTANSATTVDAGNGLNPVDRLFGALEGGDAHAARDALTEDALVWHNFDRVEQDRDQAHTDWIGLIERTTDRKATDVHRVSTEDGYVQRHNWVMTFAPGKQMAFAVCVVVTIKDGKIFRLYEYLDRAANFAPEAGA